MRSTLLPFAAAALSLPALAQSHLATTNNFGQGCQGLTLTASGAPVLGTTVSYQINGAAPTTMMGAMMVGLNAPPAPVDLSSLGLLGCYSYQYLNAVAMNILIGSPLPAYQFAVPNQPLFMDMQLVLQGVALNAAYGGGAALSDAVRSSVGIGAAALPSEALNMVAVGRGTFTMGQNSIFETEHQVTLTYPFWIGKYEVTQAEWVARMGSNPSFFQSGNWQQLPVEQVSWYDACAYCNILTQAERAAGRIPAGYEYRLPTEAEWEYCCRAGTTTGWNTGASLVAGQANFGNPNPLGQTVPVGSYAANPWGLHDTHGNVREWCLDSPDNYSASPVSDPFETNHSFFRMIRGGSYFESDSACRSAYRLDDFPQSARSFLGFRVVLAPILFPHLVGIWPGSFLMGQNTIATASPEHQVTITYPFSIGKYEVTQSEWVAQMGSNPSSFRSGNWHRRPVEQVSWNDARAYCQALTQGAQLTGRLPAGYEYRLPTEAEWEFCCRAGTTTEWNTGASLSTSQANFSNFFGPTTTVGSYAANPWGLSDTHGNVWEWCLDSFANYVAGPVSDPFVTGGTDRLVRGGSYYNLVSYCRSASRFTSVPGFTNPSVGFRIVLGPVLVP